jgi:acyl-CoA thioesterase-2
MSGLLQELLELLQLEKLEENLFRGHSQDLGFGSVFGGQVLGQALSAASQTVAADRTAHSLHAYFLRPGDASKSIIYEVDCIRDGRSFTTRRVVAIQNGRAICSLAASFQVEETGFNHQAPSPPAVEGPEGVDSDLQLVQTYQDRIPEPARTKLLCEKPIEVRTVNPVNPFAPDRRDPTKNLWIRANGPMPDDLAVHKYLLAYASDFGLVGTCLLPHGRTYWDPTMQVASIDHAMWFHRPFRIDQWLLHTMDSPNACSSRGYNRGMIFAPDGTLVASVSQEGLIRDRRAGLVTRDGARGEAKE